MTDAKITVSHSGAGAVRTAAATVGLTWRERVNLKTVRFAFTGLLDHEEAALRAAVDRIKGPYKRSVYKESDRGPLSMVAWAPIRSLFGNDWLDLSALATSKADARAKHGTDDRFRPVWAENNPVRRIIRVLITEDVR